MAWLEAVLGLEHQLLFNLILASMELESLGMLLVYRFERQMYFHGSYLPLNAILS